MSITEVQALNTQDLKEDALEVLSTLSEDQLLVVIAYARSLLGDTFLPSRVHHALETLLEETV
jgi:hypothetical protein